MLYPNDRSGKQNALNEGKSQSGDRSVQNGGRSVQNGDLSVKSGGRNAQSGDRNVPNGDRNALNGNQNAQRGSLNDPNGDKGEEGVVVTPKEKNRKMCCAQSVDTQNTRKNNADSRGNVFYVVKLVTRISTAGNGSKMTEEQPNQKLWRLCTQKTNDHS